MFPNSTGITLDNESKLSSGTKTFLFDFNSGDFALRDGKLIECDGIDAIKVWIEKNTPHGKRPLPHIYRHRVTLTLASGASLDIAKEKITESITKYLQKNAFSVGYISYAQIGGCI